MKNRKLIIKICLVLGAIGYGVACIWSVIEGAKLYDSWQAILLMIVIFLCFAIAGFIYTKEPRIKGLKRYYLIRIVIYFYSFVLICVVLNKIFHIVKFS